MCSHAGRGKDASADRHTGGWLTITRSTIADNLAEATIDGATIPEGGGVVAINVSTSIVDSTISGNRSRDMTPGGQSDSGGLLLGGDNRTFSIVNSTISGNRTESTVNSNGGGLRFFGSGAVLNVTNTTSANNVASTRGGAIEHQSGTLTLRNALLSGNLTPAGAGCFGTIASAGNNLESGNTCGLTAAGDLPNTDPQLGALADNGGPTLTHALPITSPAIDGGQATGCPAADQRGVSRSLGGACDIGAFDTARVTNRGPAPSPATVLSETLPTGVTLLSATPGRGTCDAGVPVTCQLGALAAGESVDVAFVVRTAGLGTFPAQAAVSGGEPDRTPGDLSAGAELAVGDMGLSLTNTRFRLGPLAPRMTRRTVPTGTTIRFTLSEAATARFTFQRVRAGRRVGRRCLPYRPTRRRLPRCTRLLPARVVKTGRRVGRRCLPYTRARRSRPRCKRSVRAGALTLPARAGLNQLRFDGRLSRNRPLIPGSYRMTLVATAPTGERVTSTAPFRLLPAVQRRPRRR